MESQTFQRAQRANRRATVVLVVGLIAILAAMLLTVALLVVAGQPNFKSGPGGRDGLGPFSPAFPLVCMCLAVAAAVPVVGYLVAPRAVLAFTGARIVEHGDAPQLVNVVDEARIAAGLPMPRVAIIDDPAPNAFSAGRSPASAVVVVTSGLLEAADREQLAAVVAHEVAHIANGDTALMTAASTTAALAGVLGAAMVTAGRPTRTSTRTRGGRSGGGGSILLVLAGVLGVVGAALVRASLSRTRESLADATAVELTRNPAGLRRALELLEQDTAVVRARADAVAHLWIESPGGRRSGSTLSSHPPLSARIDAVRAIETGGPVVTPRTGAAGRPAWVIAVTAAVYVAVLTAGLASPPVVDQIAGVSVKKEKQAPGLRTRPAPSPAPVPPPPDRAVADEVAGVLCGGVSAWKLRQVDGGLLEYTCTPAPTVDSLDVTSLVTGVLGYGQSFTILTDRQGRRAVWNARPVRPAGVTLVEVVGDPVDDVTVEIVTVRVR